MTASGVSLFRAAPPGKHNPSPSLRSINRNESPDRMMQIAPRAGRNSGHSLYSSMAVREAIQNGSFASVTGFVGYSGRAIPRLLGIICQLELFKCEPSSPFIGKITFPSHSVQGFATFHFDVR